MAVKKDDPRPSYVQIADDLRREINSGRFKPGERLPSGKELARSYGVALQTLQNALGVLKAEGLVATHPPRGTFVRSATPPSTASHSPEYVEIMRHLDSIQEQLTQLERRVDQMEEASPQRPSTQGPKGKRSSRRVD